MRPEWSERAITVHFENGRKIARAHVVTAGAQTLLSAEFRTQIQTDED
jgi:hypothetical protein